MLKDTRGSRKGLIKTGRVAGHYIKCMSFAFMQKVIYHKESAYHSRVVCSHDVDYTIIRRGNDKGYPQIFHKWIINNELHHLQNIQNKMAIIFLYRVLTIYQK